MQVLSEAKNQRIVAENRQEWAFQKHVVEKLGGIDFFQPLGKMLKFTKYILEGMVLGGPWLCHVMCANEINDIEIGDYFIQRISD